MRIVKVPPQIADLRREVLAATTVVSCPVFAPVTNRTCFLYSLAGVVTLTQRPKALPKATRTEARTGLSTTTPYVIGVVRVFLAALCGSAELLAPAVCHPASCPLFMDRAQT